MLTSDIAPGGRPHFGHDNTDPWGQNHWTCNLCNTNWKLYGEPLPEHLRCPRCGHNSRPDIHCFRCGFVECECFVESKKLRELFDRHASTSNLPNGAVTAEEIRTIENCRLDAIHQAALLMKEISDSPLGSPKSELGRRQNHE